MAAACELAETGLKVPQKPEVADGKENLQS
jgi:hypothetical protein